MRKEKICGNCQAYVSQCDCVNDDHLVNALNNSNSEMMIEISEKIEALVNAREKWHKYPMYSRAGASALENKIRKELRDLGIPIENRDE